MFHDSIQENIRYGSTDLPDSKIEKAAEISGIYDHVISLNDGFNSMVGDKGTKLSGGQKQRIAIARAILKDSDIIILDEATSGLDSESEKMVYDELVNIYKNKITQLVFIFGILRLINIFD